AQARKLDSAGDDSDGASEAKAAQPPLLRFRLGIAHLAAQFALLLEHGAAKEVGEGAVQVAQRFLRRALRYFVHPGHASLFERVQLPMEVNGRGTLAPRAIVFLLAPQPPLLRPA